MGLTGRAGIVRLFLLVMLPPLLLAGLYGWSDLQQREEATVRDRVTLARSAAIAADAYVEGSLMALSVLARSADLAAADDVEGLLAVLTREVERNPSWEVLGIYDAEAWVLISTAPGIRPRSVNLADRAHVVRALSEGRPTVGDATISRGRGVPVVSIAHPIQFASGERGVLLAALTLTDLERQLRDVLDSVSLRLVVVDATGRVFIHPDPAMVNALIPLADRPDAAAVLRRETGGVRTVALDGVEVLSTYAPAPASGWGVLVQEPVDLAFGAVQRERWVAFGGLALVTLVSVALAWWLGGRLATLHRLGEERRRRAEAAVGARDQFLMIAAHELRTPTAGIKGHAQLAQRVLGRETLDVARLRRGLRAIEASADRLAGLIDDLLDVGRLQRGELRLRPAELDLTALVAEAVRRQQRHDEDMRLVLDAPNAPVPLVGDPGRLDQVVENLLHNALKYSPADGTVHVTVGADATGATLTVRDEGIGVPAGAADQIFQPFGRATNVTSKNLPGMGLGLYISRQIVEAHGGRIAVTSPGDGLGATFSVWLPSCAAPAAAAPPASQLREGVGA